MRLKFLLTLIILFPLVTSAQKVQRFNDSWEFVKDVDSVFIGQLLGKKGDVTWERISLPHTANIEPIQKNGKQQWQGTCYYRKYFSVPATDRGKHIAIQFDAAMQVADVYLNGKHIYKHLGGYLPFYMDVSDKVLFDVENSILVKLNNEDNPLVPPGKPLKDLDFNYYSGIYRNAWLITKDKLHITNGIESNRTAGGGVFVYYENVSPASASLVVKTDVKNDSDASTEGEVRITLADQAGKKILTDSKKQSISKSNFGTFKQSLVVPNPVLWSPENPYLYQLTVELVQNGNTIDRSFLKTGIKTVRVSKQGFFLNDKHLVIRGTNRHQDYPYLGNAVSDNAQYRDAYKIKLAGFNFVRSSHYPQSPAFLDACDELGLMVMDAIPGWQFIGNDEFKDNSYRDIRDMIRRDRNHASIILWEASLNESGMKKDYMQKAHEIVHEELPLEGIYSAGWINDVYDVFLPARQHANAPDYWKKYDKERPILIAEYGDWEYYAQNAGFNQKEFKDLKEEERTSRQLRGFGEKRLLQQALNYQEAHNDNLHGIALGDANWLMFDYNRGYADDIESSGIMDIFRLPKFAFYFYQSQVHPQALESTSFDKPLVFIANYWQKESSPSVLVFSNCEEVELLLNGKSMGRQRPKKDDYSTHLLHPPFIFRLPSFQAGTLTAVGYIGNKKITEHKVATADDPVAIKLRADISGKEFAAGQNDVVFVYAEILDSKGVIVPGATNTIEFDIAGDAEIVGLKNIQAEAGIATIVLRAGAKPGKIIISAKGTGLKAGQMVLESK